MKPEDILNVIKNSTGVTIDTRTMSKGEVFFAISGDNFDGNKFIEKALENGAVLAIGSDEKYKNRSDVVVVKDVLVTMQKLARLYRSRFDIPIIAITGTNGKTTTKELLCTILSGKYNVLCTKGNFNNHIGVPLTLFSLGKEHQIGIVEMGASSLGEIKFLCEIAQPDFGVITSIGKAHIEGFGSLENIVKTKLELFEYLVTNDGSFFFNEAVSEIEEYMKSDKCIKRFNAAQINGNVFSSLEVKNGFPYISLEIFLNDGSILECDTRLYGRYNFNNIVTSVKISDFFGVDSEVVTEKLSEYVPINNRSQILTWNSNTVVLDAYNANPTSMMEALKSFLDIVTVKNKYLILGDMLELGSESVREHKRIIEFIHSNNEFINVLFIGKEFLKAKKELAIHHNDVLYFEDSDIAKRELLSMDLRDSLILAKGSRGIKVETIFLQT